MSNQKFDKNLKSVVDKHPSTIDVDVFWGSIEGEVKKINAAKKKKRVVPFYFLRFAALVIGGVLVAFYFIDSNDYPPMRTSSVAEKHVRGDQFSTPVLLDSARSTDRSEAQFSIPPLTRTSSAAEKHTSEAQFFPPVLLDIARSTHGSEAQFSTSPLTRTSSPAEKHISEAQILIPLVEVIDLKKMTLLKSGSFVPNLDFEYYELISKYRYRGQKTWEYNIGIQGGLNFAPRRLENLTPESIDYATLRNQTESSRIGFQVGLKTGLKHQSGLSFSTGINYTQINERFQYRGSTFKQTFVENGVVGYEININMDTIPVIGNLDYIQEIVHNKDYQNQYRLFEIPLLIGFQKDFDQWTFGLQTGIYANISMQTRGLIFTPTNEFAFLESDQTDFFQFNIGMSYYIGGEGKYLINDNFALTFSPHFRLFPKNFTNGENELIQKYSLAGLNLGVEFRF